MNTHQWILGIAAALLVGFSKTGMPGVGILVVPMLAAAFGGRLSVGVMLPLLILGDCFAVYWYRHHARWDRLGPLIPWVLPGMALGALALWALGNRSGGKDLMDVVIGALVLGMLAVQLARMRLKDRIVPHSRAAVASTGAVAGFSTTVSNAAGPIMSIYLTAMGLPKEQFMGTTAWYFFIFNLSKFPVYLALTAMNPTHPIMNRPSLLADLMLAPGVLVGVAAGKWLLPYLPQKLFDGLVLGLAGVAALKLIMG
ncbi:MAG: sulfite exporter TauE/SafE family protein [Chthonomonadales bacterium]